MSLVLLIIGTYLCAAAEFPIPRDMLIPSAIYAIVYDMFKLNKGE